MLEDINENKSVHVVTLEDPIEYQHPHKKSTFNQRELGADFDTLCQRPTGGPATGPQGHSGG
jgi:Tfp pilus assembly pilus retraction ATPase PilT